MSKALKITAAIIIVLLTIFVIGGLLGPKEFKMERSTVIHAPRGVVFANISDYRNWIKWSPWYELDTAAKYEYFGQPGQADAGYRWEGNDKAGKGEMRTTEIAQDMDLKADLHFLKPFESKAKIAFTLDSAAGGDTKVTWAFGMAISFFMRTPMLFMNMESKLSKDFEKGLAKLKAVSESGSSSAAAPMEVKEVQWAAKTYISYRTQTSTDSLAAIFPLWMPKVYEYAAANKLEMDGAAAGIYYTWDPEKKRTDMSVAIPVKKADKASAPLKVETVAASRALVVDYYGPYDNMQSAHELIAKYIKEKGLKKKGTAIEEYVTDPGVEKDPVKVLTKIYYLID